MNHTISTLLMIFVLLPLSLTQVVAQDEVAPGKDCPDDAPECGKENVSPPDEQAKDSKTFFSFLDKPQSMMAGGLTGMTTYMDEFFAEERVFYDKTGSYVRITADTIFDENGEVGYAGDIKLKLRLPRTEEKLKLTFESDPEEQRDSLDRTLEESPEQAARERDYYGGIQATLGDERKWRFKPSIGVKFDKPIDIFLRLRMDRSYKTGDWLFRPSQTFYTFKEKGFGSDTAFELDHSLTDNLLFRSSSFLRYQDENDYFEPSQVFSLVHSLSERRGMAYQIGVYGVSEPTWQATDYLAQLRYRQRIHSHYLFVELIPKAVYRRENNFEPEHSFTLRLEMVLEG
ncbi:MAG: hypothetical protein RI563_04430 [Thiohalophilus sp.]|uniref:hypothetical protein n=1 Tax=Thiohalophilus sp. TaxID=3028392 RepID=UPI00287050B3|nr:hypothetical protein [Thiohalophilus sp.]MDR9436097.1 hypothetical protein [Thiohalophilus sp.]